MQREEAMKLVLEKAEKQTTVRHLISVEGIMRALASHLGQDEKKWGLAGLLHDIDMETTHGDMSIHAFTAAEWLKELDVDSEIINAVIAHAHPEYRTDLMSRGIVCADALSGLVVAAALVRPEKADGMKVSSVKKKLKDKAFAPGVARDDIHSCEELTGVELDVFLGIGIAGVQSVASEIGL